MEYPVVLDGEKVGTLRVERQGLFTEFFAQCRRKTGVVRLWVVGGGRRGCLGVMSPENGCLTLFRRFSAAQMKDLPETIEYAAPLLAGEAPQPKPEVKAEPPAPLSWQRSSRGCLVRQEGGETFVALPAKLRRIPRGVRLTRIDGRDYMVFRY